MTEPVDNRSEIVRTLDSLGVRPKANNELDILKQENSKGFIPGSRRTIQASAATAPGLLTAQKSLSIAIPHASNQVVILGDTMKLVARVVAKDSTGANISALVPTIGLQEECPNLLWPRINMKLGGRQFSRSVDARLARHVIDRYYIQHNNATDTEVGYRMIDPDSDVVNKAIQGSGTVYDTWFKQDMIADGRQFDLVRPLTDMPLCAPGDAPIPTFLDITYDLMTTDQPQNLFQCESSVTGAPYMEVQEVYIEYDTVKIQPELYQKLEIDFTIGNLFLSGDEWSDKLQDPPIKTTDTTWNQTVYTPYESVPDVVYWIGFPQQTFTPGATFFNEVGYQLIHYMCAMSSFSFIAGDGTELKSFRFLDGIGGKVKLIDELNKTIQQTAGNIPGKSGIMMTSAANKQYLTSQNGFGVVPLAMRNWAEKLPHLALPVSIKSTAALGDTATPIDKNTFIYLIAKTRHRYKFSPDGVFIVK